MTQPTNQTKETNSISKVHNPRESVPDYVSGVREPIAVRIDTGVYKRFKPVSKRFYGSTCRAVETYMISLIEVAEKGVHFSNTDKPISIDKIVIERNLSHERRNLFGAAKPERKLDKCRFCGKKIVGQFRYVPTQEVYGLCEFHAEKCLANKNWSVAK